MAGEKVGSFYCWSWWSGGLRIYVASSEKGAHRVGLALKDEGDGCTYFHRRLSLENVEENKEKNRLLISAVEAALRNRPVIRDIAMDVRATPFQWKAWRAIAEIPFGETRTYGEVAAWVGKAGGARAIGQAMGRNPLPLIFP